MAELNFTNEQRLIIALLCDVLTEPKKRQFRQENIDLIMHAVCGGHNWAIDWELGAMFPEEVDSRERVRFVADVLDMWEFIELRWSRLTADERQTVQDAIPFLGNGPQFIGFDGNNESGYMSIASTMVERMNRFATFKGRSLNSHKPKVGRYRDMLTKWPDIRATLANREMTVEQMIELLKRD